VRARIDALDTLAILRLGLLALAVGAVLVTTLELTFLAHWDGTLQLLPWAALAMAAIAIALLVVRSRPAMLRTARVLAVIVFAMGGVGVLVHVIQNRDAGVLDYRYADTWATMGDLRQWWLAATGGVGPSPPLAPMSLAFAALLILLAGLRLPDRVTRRAEGPGPAAVPAHDARSARR
jgi:hypothetical protein